jgi:nucleotide-binding universal stress UspA family protein
MAEAPFSPADPIHSLLVPLDGSKLAETAVHSAMVIARSFSAKVVLLHVLEADPPIAVHGQPHLTNQAEAISYLQTIAGQFIAAGLAVEAHVHEDPARNVSASIADHVEDYAIDLIVMANHGSGGFRSLLFGRVAQQVLQSGRRPVLALPANGEARQAPAEFQRIALLLNRTAESESAIPLAIAFSAALKASLSLIYCVPTLGTLGAEQSASATLMPSASRELLNIEERSAADYLNDISASLRGYALNVGTSVVRGEPSSKALEEADRIGADLLVMTTHARGGISGLWSGSVGSKILARTSIPLLLVPAVV